jgi:hypothetical protein
MATINLKVILYEYVFETHWYYSNLNLMERRNLTRWPSQLPATQNVNVEMENGLTAFFSIVYHCDKKVY